MQPIFREFTIWLVQFLCISLGLLIAVHLIAKRFRQKDEDTSDKVTDES
jgi:hypothetical protein